MRTRGKYSSIALAIATVFASSQTTACSNPDTTMKYVAFSCLDGTSGKAGLYQSETDLNESDPTVGFSQEFGDYDFDPSVSVTYGVLGGVIDEDGGITIPDNGEPVFPYKITAQNVPKVAGDSPGLFRFRVQPVSFEEVIEDRQTKPEFLYFDPRGEGVDIEGYSNNGAKFVSTANGKKSGNPLTITVDIPGDGTSVAGAEAMALELRCDFATHPVPNP